MSEPSPSTRLRGFSQLCLMRWREVYRESEVIIWSFIFPVVLAIGLGLAFGNRPAEVTPVAVSAGPRAAEITAALTRAQGLSVQGLDQATAAHALRMGKVALVVVPDGGSVSYRYDPSRPDSLLARARVNDALQRAAGRQDPLAVSEQQTREPGARYIDFLIPGILGMNLMSGGMWGVGYHLVDMRIKRLLKRLVATPMRRSDFMLSQMAVRVVFVLFEAAFILGFARLSFGVPIRGAIPVIALTVVLGALSFSGLGLLVAARPRTVEKATGLMNLIQMPMFICSGIFFSAERFPDWLQPLIHALPLTALIDALRAVILEGTSLASQAHELGILATWAVASFLTGLRFFRWD
jgi:ABC-2 type transport system permease protein